MASTYKTVLSVENEVRVVVDTSIGYVCTMVRRHDWSHPQPEEPHPLFGEDVHDFVLLPGTKTTPYTCEKIARGFGATNTFPKWAQVNVRVLELGGPCVVVTAPDDWREACEMASTSSVHAPFYDSSSVLDPVRAGLQRVASVQSLAVTAPNQCLPIILAWGRAFLATPHALVRVSPQSATAHLTSFLPDTFGDGRAESPGAAATPCKVQFLHTVPWERFHTHPEPMPQWRLVGSGSTGSVVCRPRACPRPAISDAVSRPMDMVKVYMHQTDVGLDIRAARHMYKLDPEGVFTMAIPPPDPVLVCAGCLPPEDFAVSAAQMWALPLRPGKETLDEVQVHTEAEWWGVLKDLTPLFIGLEVMQTKRYPHHDIKGTNIVRCVNGGGFRYIDFALGSSNRFNQVGFKDTIYAIWAPEYLLYLADLDGTGEGFPAGAVTDNTLHTYHNTVLMHLGTSSRRAKTTYGDHNTAFIRAVRESQSWKAKPELLYAGGDAWGLGVTLLRLISKCTSFILAHEPRVGRAAQDLAGIALDMTNIDIRHRLCGAQARARYQHFLDSYGIPIPAYLNVV